ncbi:hypothetical protein EIP86_008566 [Pleurotus ostreatoroseus]|nr:hypothetical protein EIP86_008566 [Pleurotus ostreatoroseus]
MFAKPSFSRRIPSSQREDDDGGDDSDFEDAAWITQQIGNAFTLITPSSPIISSNTDLHARPDSIPPPPRMRTAGRSRFSKPLPIVPRASIPPHPVRGPSIQLDPTFHAQADRHPAIPSRLPPPPPIRIDCPSPTMEEKTEELLRLLANAALDGGFLGTGLGGSLSPLPLSVPVTPSSAYIPDTPSHSRPLPRISLPADIDGGLDEPAVSGDSEPSTATIDTFELDLEDSAVPRTPPSLSVYSQPSASLSADALPGSPFTFTFEVSELDLSLPLTPTAIADGPSAGGVGMYDSPAPERVLRSRWSSSTLSSLVDTHQVPHSASSWMLRFNLGSSSATKKDKTKSSGRPSFSRPSLKLGLPLKTPTSPPFKRSSGHKRRESCNSSMSDCSSDSGDSTTSSGLRRKPIPVEIFMR